MNQSNNNPNEEWRKIFESASETPPPGVWDAIEKHLDEQAEAPAPIPLWRSPATWLSAASVFLLLGVGTAVYLNYDASAPSTQLAETVITVPAAESTHPEKLSTPSEDATASAKTEDTDGNTYVSQQPASSATQSFRRTQNRSSQRNETLLAGNVSQKSLQTEASGDIIQPAATSKISADASVCRLF